MPEGNSFSSKTLEKSHGLAGQFWLLESTLCCFSLVYSLVYVDKNKRNKIPKKYPVPIF